MNEEIKFLAGKTVDKIYRKIKKIQISDFHKLAKNVGVGADGTPTSYIDKIAEDVAIDFLRKSKTKVNILSEEIGFLDLGGDYTFVLDPVDGTRNASRGIPFFSVSLGVGKKSISDLEYGIVKNIPTGDTFIAEKGCGAFLNNTRVSVPDVPANLLHCSLALGKNFDDFTVSLAKKDIVRSLGSASLEMCMVAIGALDFFVVGREYMRVVDIAASTLILREAGGVVTNILGEELNMSFDLDGKSSVIATYNMDLVHRIIS